LKEKSVELGENAMLVFCDDKAKVPVGEPGCAVSTGVRGKKTLAPVSTTLVSLDHDMTKCSLTPSVVLNSKIPNRHDDSFVRGKVYVAVNDFVYQSSSPFHHAAMIVNILPRAIPILVTFTDDGVDQRNTLEAVKCSAICIFRELNLDMIIMARCAPGQSWMNPAERVMSMLNLGLQNCAQERSIEN
jgi:hypothetical protein